MLDSSLRGRGFEPHRRHCVVSLSKNINPSFLLVQPRKTGSFMMGRKESNQTNKQTIWHLKTYKDLSLVLLNLDLSSFENIVDPDQLASYKAI